MSASTPTSTARDNTVDRNARCPSRSRPSWRPPAASRRRGSPSRIGDRQARRLQLHRSSAAPPAASTRPFRMRVVDSTGEQSATVSTTVQFVEDGNAASSPTSRSLNSTSQNLTEVTPGQNITLHVHRATTSTSTSLSPRRRLRPGQHPLAPPRRRRHVRPSRSRPASTTTPTQTSRHDVPVAGLLRGRSAARQRERRLPDTGGASGAGGGLGNAVVNDAAPRSSARWPSRGAAAEHPAVGQPRRGATSTPSATDGRHAGRRVQVIEWDADGDSAFERREYTVPTNIGRRHRPPARSAPAKLTQTSTPRRPAQDRQRPDHRQRRARRGRQHPAPAHVQRPAPGQRHPDREQRPRRPRPRTPRPPSRCSATTRDNQPAPLSTRS